MTIDSFTMRLELVPVPVNDIDRAQAYVDQLGFRVDHNVPSGNGMRVLQLTRPGSIAIGAALGDISAMTPGSVKALQVVVDDIATARETLIGRSVEVGAVVDHGGILFARFAVPEGNSWLLQEIPA